MGVIWTFLYILLEDVAVRWDHTFHHQKLLQGIMLGTECLVGEVPSLFLSGQSVEENYFGKL